MRIVIALLALAASSTAVAAEKGEALFNRHCKACHPDGGNIMTPDKTLKKKDMEANGLQTEAAVVKYLRKPGKGMPAYDTAKLPEKEARELAAYILKTFR